MDDDYDALMYVGWFEKMEGVNNSDSTSLKEANQMSDAIQVKIGKLGERTEEFTLASDATVKDLVAASGKETSGYQFRVNGETASLATALQDDDIVQLLPAVKGG